MSGLLVPGMPSGGVQSGCAAAQDKNETGPGDKESQDEVISSNPIMLDFLHICRLSHQGRDEKSTVDLKTKTHSIALHLKSTSTPTLPFTLQQFP